MREDGRTEQDVVGHSVRAWMGTEPPGALQALLAGPVDWARVLRLSRKHKVSPLVASVLCGRWVSACPPDFVERLRSTARECAVNGLAAAHSLSDAVRLLESEHITVIAYKGPLLATLAYKQPGLREFTDLDVLVARWDYFHRVGPLLLKNGWTNVADYHFERSYLNADRRIALDVHRAFTFTSLMPLHVDFATLFERAVEADVVGAPVKTFAPTDLLIVLCVQLAKDTDEERPGPLMIKVCDIAQLVRSHPNLDWDAILREARRLGVLHIVCLGLAVAADLLGCPVPQEVEALSANVPELDSLVRHVDERIFAVEQQRYSRPELLDPLVWNAALRERWRDSNRSLIALRETLFEPNEPDYAFVRLPREFDSLYRWVRPVRLAWKAGRRLVGRPIA